MVGLIPKSRLLSLGSRPRLLRETVGAGTPIDNLRLLDLVTRVGGGGRAMRFAQSAVDVDRSSAGATDRVVVIDTDPILVEGRRPGGLNTPEEALLDQRPEGVVYRLSRDGTDLGANGLGDLVCRAVRPTRYRAQHGQTLGRDLETVFAKEVGWIVRHD